MTVDRLKRATRGINQALATNMRLSGKKNDLVRSECTDPRIERAPNPLAIANSTRLCSTRSRSSMTSRTRLASTPAVATSPKPSSREYTRE